MTREARKKPLDFAGKADHVTSQLGLGQSYGWWGTPLRVGGCVSCRLLTVTIFATSAALLEVCAILNAILVVSANRFIWLEVNLLVKFIEHNQNYYLKLDVSTSVGGLRQKKLLLCSSDS